jgi:hypothetical protein
VLGPTHHPARTGNAFWTMQESLVPHGSLIHWLSTYHTSETKLFLLNPQFFYIIIIIVRVIKVKFEIYE